MANLPFDITANPTFRDVQVMCSNLTAVARGEAMMTLTGGGTGIGKTFEARQICRRVGIKHLPEERPDGLEGLVSFLWLNRECEVCLLDEVDNLLRHEETLNMLKVSQGDPRVVSHGSQQSIRNEQYKAEGSRRYRDYIAPTRFPLYNKLRPIMTSNENYTDPEVIARLPKVHWNALVGRGLDPHYIRTEGRDGLDLFEFTYHTATEGGMLRSLQFTWDVSRATIDFYLRNIHALIDIHPRRLKMIAEAIRDHPAPDDHMTRLQSMLRQDDQRPRLVLPRTWVQVGGPDSLFLPRRPPPPKHPHRHMIADLWARTPQWTPAKTAEPEAKPVPPGQRSAIESIAAHTGDLITSPNRTNEGCRFR